MKSCRIPQTNVVVSRIAYGCAYLAAWDKNPLSVEDVAKATEVIHVACDNGITLFDHADLYAFGKAEIVFGRILKQSPGLRQKIVIQSKCGQRFPDGWVAGQPIQIDLSREHILSSVEGSLGRLGTDRLDILLLHVADSLVQPEEVAHAFDELYRAGKVRYFGVSNHNAAQIQMLKKNVQQPIIVNQIRVGLGYPRLLADGMEFALSLAKGGGSGDGFPAVAGTGTLEYCRRHDIQIQAYSPLRGELSKSRQEVEPKFKQVAQLLGDVAAKNQTAPSAVALAWLLHHPAGIVPIIGSTDLKHIAANCEADRISLSNDDWYSLLAATTEISPR
jgi:predicted oxidoreductase